MIRGKIDLRIVFYEAVCLRRIKCEACHRQTGHKSFSAVVNNAYALQICHGVGIHFAVYAEMFFVLQSETYGVCRSADSKLYARSVGYSFQYVRSYFFFRSRGRLR